MVSTPVQRKSDICDINHVLLFLVHGDASTIVLCIAFATLYVAFFVVFPGIRKEVSVRTADPYCAYSFMGRAIMLISSIMGLL